MSGALAIHVGVAESGKLCALRGDHTQALAHYRDAMRLAVSTGAPEVFFRHYMDIALESIELMGDHGSVIACSDRAIAQYAAAPPETDVARKDLASMHLRRGAALLKAGRAAEAREALERARAIAATAGVDLPLAGVLLRWIAGGLHVSAERVTAEQRRHGYYSVRSDTVEARRAVGRATIHERLEESHGDAR